MNLFTRNLGNLLILNSQFIQIKYNANRNKDRVL